MNYLTALRRSGKILEAYFDQSKDILHSASKGAIREQIINKVIRPYLPSCCGLSGGEAFDFEGNTSKQLDLVVYDSVFSYIVPYIDNFIQFPCESIYGNIEIKSFLNGEELSRALENIKSMKCLKRKGTHSWTVTPQVAISINGTPSDTNRNPYFGIIFAYDSIEVATILSHLQQVAIPSNLLPNAIVLYSKKTIILHGKKSALEIFPCNDFDNYSALYCGDDTLALFIGLLITFTRFTLLSAANIPTEISQSFQMKLDENNHNGTTQVILI